VYSAKFEEEITRLKADNISGSEEIVRNAMKIVDIEIENNPEKYKNISDLSEMLAQVMKIKKEMAALKNVLIYFIDFYHEGVALEDISDRVLTKLDTQRQSIIDKLLPHLKKCKSIMTFSRSSTIVQSLIQLSEIVAKEKLPETLNLDDLEKSAITKAMNKHKGNISKFVRNVIREVSNMKNSAECLIKPQSWAIF